MELNYSLKLAEQYIKPIEPITYNEIKKALTIAGKSNLASNLAITRLLEMIGFYQKRNYGTRKRYLKQTIVNCLEMLADLTVKHGYKAFNRNEFFLNLAHANDFTILQHWKLIERGEKKGSWSITKLGMQFVANLVPLHESVIQIGGHKKNNYTIDNNSRMVYFSDIMPCVVISDEVAKFLEYNK